MISIIIGSARKNSQSEKVGAYISDQLKKMDIDKNVNIIKLHHLNLPLWNEEQFNENSEWQNVSKILKSSSAYIIITPEWDGMASPAIKNFFNYCRDREMFHKPALLISVSAGQGGSYPISELRMSSYKNSRVCYLPEHVIVRHVEEVLNHESPINDNDTMIRNRLAFALKTLLCYESAFKSIWQQDFLYTTTYQNGM